MTIRIKVWATGLMAAVAMVGAGSASAVATYGNILDVTDSPIAGPGVYFGTGNSNGNWTIDTTNGIEVALRAKDRGTLQTIDGSSGVYHASPGLCNPVCSGGNKAAWNYEFSVNTRASGGTSDLLGFATLIRVDTNPGAGTTFTGWLNVYSNWGDNYYISSSTQRDAVGGVANSADDGPLPGEYGVQQSSNPLFGDSGFQPGFNPFSTGTYEIELAVFGLNTDGSANLNNLLAATDITVQVPEPGSLALMGLALFGLGAVRRYRKS